VAVCAIGPPLGLLVLSFGQPMLVPRYAIASVPAVVVGAVLLVSRLRGARAAVVYTLLIASGVVLTVVQTDQPYKYEDFRGAAAMIVRTAHPGDGLLYQPSSSRVGLVPYLDSDRRTGVVPADLALTSATSLRDGPVIGGAERPCPAEPARVYLVGSSPTATGHDPAVDDLRADYDRVWQRRFGDVTVTLYRRDTRPAGRALTGGLDTAVIDEQVAGRRGRAPDRFEPK
jgi:hypothetical protein